MVGMPLSAFQAVPIVVCPSKSNRIFFAALGRECRLNASALLMTASGVLGCSGTVQGAQTRQQASGIM